MLRLRALLPKKRLGWTRLFMEDGKQSPCDRSSARQTQVVAQRTIERDGLHTVQLGAG